MSNYSLSLARAKAAFKLFLTHNRLAGGASVARGTGTFVYSDVETGLSIGRLIQGGRWKKV